VTNTPRLVPLADKHAETSADILNWFIAMIEADQISEVAIVGIGRDGTTFCDWTVGAKRVVLAGGVATLQHELQTAQGA
jgi:hypothetical protein